ncbi:MAG: hypothetical protein PHD04_02710 [Candidatus Pacebacteria bacterium]|nr:hypothetical protein [Candidatus Paceibacterota bacterium]
MLQHVAQHIVEYTVLAFLVAIFFWRIVLPGMKMRTSKAPAPAPVAGAAGTSSIPPTTTYEKTKEWFIKRLWTILLALAGAGIFWKLYKPGLRLSGVGDWSWDNWLWLLVFGAIVFVLIKLNEKTLGTMAKTLESVLVGAMFMLFLGIPAGIWVKDLFLPQVICKDGNTSSLTTCKLNTGWSSMFRASEGKSADGANLCYSPSSMVVVDYLEVNGSSFYRLRSKEGIVEARYIFKKLPPGQTKCPKI